MQEDHLNAQMNAMIIQQNETKSCPFSSAGLDCPIKARQLLDYDPEMHRQNRLGVGKLNKR